MRQKSHKTRRLEKLEALNITNFCLFYMKKRKAFSPSCGCGLIFIEDFSDKKLGDGTTTALLKRNGIKVTTELDHQ